MSVVVWDGKSLAADKQGQMGDMKITVNKTRRFLSDIGLIVMAWTGEQEQGLMLADWFCDGAAKDKYPAFQNTDYWSCLVIVDDNGLSYFEKQPVRQVVTDSFIAFGSGRYYAMGAMAMGADAEKAVLIASMFDAHCGCGVDVLRRKSNFTLDAVGCQQDNHAQINDQGAFYAS